MSKYLISTLLCFFSLPAAAAEEQPVAMLPLEASRVPAEIAAIIEGLVLQTAHDACKRRVLGTADIRAMLDVEILKQAAGCDGSDAYCFAQIGGALGASHIFATGLTTLGEELILSLTVIDQTQTTVLAREQARIPRDETLYADAVSTAVTRVFREAGLARPPSRNLERERSTMGVTGWSLLGGAAALAIAGGVIMAVRPGPSAIEDHQYQLYLDALSGPEVAAAYDDVRGAVDQHNTMTTVGWVLFGAGAAAAGAGLLIFLFRPTEEEVLMSFTPGPDGGALLLGGRF